MVISKEYIPIATVDPMIRFDGVAFDPLNGIPRRAPKKITIRKNVRNPGMGARFGTMWVSGYCIWY